MHMSRTRRDVLTFSVASLALCFAMATAKAASPTVDAVLKETGVRGGFAVVLGGTDGELAAGLKQAGSFQVQVLSRDAATVQHIRQSLQQKAIYGDAASDLLQGDALPYIDNLVNLLVVEDSSGISAEEIDRVLVPNGVAYVKGADGGWTKTVKPRPESIDDWSHYLHDPSGNAVAHDDIVGPPRHLQWVGSPRWSRHHDRMASMSGMVSSNGRIFYIMDEGSRISIQMPPKWKVIARDAFNGTVLWKRDMENWQNHLWPLKSGPTQLARRIVSTNDVLYVTLAFEAPLTALDAATGETIRTYEGTGSCEEVIVDNGLMFIVSNKQRHELVDFAPLHNTGDQARVKDEYDWDEKDRVLMAVEASTGKQLWAKTTRVAPLTLTCDADQVYFHDGEKLHAVKRETGDVVWSTEPIGRRQSVTFNFGPRVVAWEDRVLFAGGDNKMSGVDRATGKIVWSADHPNSGYQSPQDLMVIDGLVWCAPTTSGKDTGVFTGRDPSTGEVKKEFPPNIDTYWFHHRCYISKATDNFIIPSRTGVEFVDFKSENWDINHWVRGGCLYGVMPCNGLTYTPPHDCACYPEAKLYGLNALAAPAKTRLWPREVSEEGRLEQGPAFGIRLAEASIDPNNEWPTYRHDEKRSGTVMKEVPSKVAQKWEVKLSGRLTQPVIAGGQLYVGQTDAHTLHVFDAESGAEKWTHTIGGRIDSPPTIAKGRVVFGGADGFVYCLSAADGKLVWRYRAAPHDTRLMAFEQLESVWPVHGSVLVQNDQVYCTAGRSCFLDGGIRVLRLNLDNGAKLSETIMDDRNPATGKDLQDLLQILQMPVGLTDILSSDGERVYMRSQVFDLEGNRGKIAPNSGDFVSQVAEQRGEEAHLFAPMGFLDDSWFHRSYWVYGRAFAGGHGGYYQAGRFAPSGEILVNGGGYVYGYGRKPQYLKWTTTIERQLFAAADDPPAVPEEARKPAPANGSGVTFAKSPSLDPTDKPVSIEAWINSTRPGGVVAAMGGPTDGYTLYLEQGKPHFAVRRASKLTTASGTKRIVGEWHHLAGVLTKDGELRLYVDGERVATQTGSKPLDKYPAQGLDIGIDGGTSVGDYKEPFPFAGMIDEVRVYYSALTAEDVQKRSADVNADVDGEAVVVLDFNDGDARDMSPHRNNGTLTDGESVEGKAGRAIKFAGQAKANNAGRQGNSFVEPKWTVDLPIYVRSMLLAQKTLIVAGPEDIIDEEETFKRQTEKDKSVEPLLARQGRILDGEEGGLLLIVDADSGETKQKLELPAPPAWDTLSTAYDRVYLTTIDGRVLCLSGQE